MSPRRVRRRGSAFDRGRIPAGHPPAISRTSEAASACTAVGDCADGRAAALQDGQAPRARGERRSDARNGKARLGPAEVRADALLVALILSAAPVRASIDPAAFKDLAFRQHPGAQLPMGARLIDSGDRPSTLGSALAGRPAVFVLEYLRCNNLCGLVLRGASNAI